MADLEHRHDLEYRPDPCTGCGRHVARALAPARTSVITDPVPGGWRHAALLEQYLITGTDFIDHDCTEAPKPQ